MPDALDTLRSLFADGIVEESVRENNGRRYMRLKETAPDARLKQVDLYDLPAESLLLKLDKSAQPKTLFKGTHGECKRCDYLLITHLKGKHILLFIEMKSRTLKENDVRKHFKASECVLDYASAVLERFFSLPRFFDSYEKRFVVFYKNSAAKRKLGAARHSTRNSTPEQMKKCPSPYEPTLGSLI